MAAGSISFHERSREFTFTLTAAMERQFWLEPQVELAYNHHLSRKQLREIEALIDEHFEEIVSAWRDYFGS
jgi:Domain of unknown function (DUF4160)